MEIFDQFESIFFLSANRIALPSIIEVIHDDSFTTAASVNLV